jgi:16S rRNA (cytosine967-C5)-methyltransferase
MGGPRYANKILAVAIESLSWIELENAETVGSAVARASSQLGLTNPKDFRIAKRLVYETLNRKNLIDIFLRKVLEDPERYELGVKAFLSLFVYLTKLIHNPSDPVVLAKQGRNILGWKTIMPVELALGRLSYFSHEELLTYMWGDEKISFNTFYPSWFVKYVRRLFGHHMMLKILSPGIRPRTLFRINALRVGEKELCERLSSKDICLESIPYLPLIYSFSGKKLNLRTEIETGYIKLQDYSSSLAAIVGEPRKRKAVFVVGAAPSFLPAYIGYLVDVDSSVIVFDSSVRRIRKVRADSKTAGVKVVETILSKENMPINLAADLVIVAAPSSRSGILWREPSLKWRVTKATFQHFANIQYGLLDFWSSRVREGGVIVYLTKSISIEEDEIVVENFLKRHPEFVLSKISPDVGIPALRGQKESRRFFPHLHLCDGSFIAKLVRI